MSGSSWRIARSMGRLVNVWQGSRDSNPEPPVLETGTLTKLSYTPTIRYVENEGPITLNAPIGGVPPVVPEDAAIERRLRASGDHSERRPY
jgi:hypothetical protein